MTFLFKKLLQTLLIVVPMSLGGCTIMKHDQALDQKTLVDDLGPAEGLAHKQAITDLGCSNLKTDEVAAKNAEGAPLGPVWTNFEIQVSGCNKVKTYKIQCEIGPNCFLSK